MNITVENTHGTGVTITEIRIIETQETFTVSIPPEGSYPINLPDMDKCHIEVTYTDPALEERPEPLARIAPVIDGDKVALVKTPGATKPLLI